MGGGAEILVCEVTIRSDRNGEITQKNNYVYLIVQIFYSQFSNLSLYLAALFVLLMPLLMLATFRWKFFKIGHRPDPI